MVEKIGFSKFIKENLRNIKGGTTSINIPTNSNNPVNTINTVQKPNKAISKKIFFIVLKALVVIFFAIVFYFAYYAFTSYNSTMSRASEIADKWPEYRCRPSVMPFASQLTGGKVNTVINGIECLITAYIQPYINAFISPFIKFFEKILDVITDLISSVQNIRKMFYYMRQSINTFLLDIANMFYAYARKISLIINRLMETFSRIFKVFEDMIYAITYIIYTIASVWNSPIGGVARYFCFHKETLITMYDGSKKPIKEVKIGDKIKKGGKVLSVHLFSGKNVKMYLYKNKIIVASSHLIRENERWVRIENSKYSVPLDKREDEIYCLTTSKSKIVVDDNVFADYMELETPEQMTHVMNIIMESLNNKEIKLTGKNEKVWGFIKDTLIKTKSEYKKVKDLKLGESLDYENKIEGITKICGKQIKLYNYLGTVCSGNVIIKKGGVWKLIKEIGKPLKNKKSVLYHIFTTNGELYINNEMYKDYDGIKDNNINDKIDEYVEKQLNYKN